MLKVVKNMLSWPIFRILARGERLAPEEEKEYIRVPEHVSYDFTREEAESCPWLDLGDRAAALFGPAALKVYLELQQFHSYLTGSVSDDMSYIFHAEYVNKGQDLSEQACLDLGMQAPPRPMPPAIPSIPEEVLTSLRKTAIWYSADRITRIDYSYIEGFPGLTKALAKYQYSVYPLIGPRWNVVSLTDEDRRFVIELRIAAERQ